MRSRLTHRDQAVLGWFRVLGLGFRVDRGFRVWRYFEFQCFGFRGLKHAWSIGWGLGVTILVSPRLCWLTRSDRERFHQHILDAAGISGCPCDAIAAVLLHRV